MAKPHEKLAESLEALRSLQERGVIAVRASDLTRTHRERLLKKGFLQKIKKGWYIPVNPGEIPGESTVWYASFWNFCAAYLNARFGEKWSLSPEHSLLLHVGNNRIPRQLLVRSPRAGNKITDFQHGTSIFEIRAALPGKGNVVVTDDLRLFSISAGLVNCGPGFFLQNETDARAALAMVKDASELLSFLLEEGRTTVAGRLAGGFRNIGRDRIADDIVKTMQAADYNVREKDPFEHPLHLISPLQKVSPYVNRIQLMWQKMRKPVIRHFPATSGSPVDISAYLKTADDNYVTDAYHSLSIEGYHISPDLIQRVRMGDWNPDEDKDDWQHQNALTARGYWQAYQKVRKSVVSVLEGENPGVVCDSDHGDWYREMFGPLVSAGLLKAGELAGYRNHQVFIRRSMHVPPRHEAIRTCMPAFFELLKNEPEPSVRVILGHFVFVYIHPYMDGNGRIGRFLMNVMLAAGGYPWTVISVEKCDVYMEALEKASVEQEIIPFTKFIGNLVFDS